MRSSSLCDLRLFTGNQQHHGVRAICHAIMVREALQQAMPSNCTSANKYLENCDHITQPGHANNILAM